MSEHTPGPWTTQQTQRGIRIFVDGRDDLNPINVGEAYGTNAIAQANARLIAAAPDLLAALRKAVYELNAIRARDGVPYTHQGWQSGVDEGYFSSVVDESFAAITKATGESA